LLLWGNNLETGYVRTVNLLSFTRSATGAVANLAGTLVAVAVSTKKAISEKDPTDHLRLSRIGVVPQHAERRERVRCPGLQPAS